MNQALIIKKDVFISFCNPRKIGDNNCQNRSFKEVYQHILPVSYFYAEVACEENPELFQQSWFLES